MKNHYLSWLAAESGSVWWNDSADSVELTNALENGAQGVTTNPVLVARTLSATPEYWAPMIAKAKDSAERLRIVTCHVAERFMPVYQKTNGAQGYVCAQVDPGKASDRKTMFEQAKRYHEWSPNIAVKLPATAAGLDVLEECIAMGITVTATVSYTFPQVLQAALRQRAGAKRAGANAGRLFAVVMVGRLDDFLRDVVHDSKLDVPESDIIQAGTAVIKRAYHYFNEQKFDAVLMPAGMRGAYHAVSLAGAKMSMSIHPTIQAKLGAMEAPYEKKIDEEVSAETIANLMKIPEFQRAFEPDGMNEKEFITYGVVQKTLAQFVENFIRI
ncbi:MAG: hypothetical protein GX946_04065 [Oligosphaeraceae bacterium]|nr:hypothetical protein [Oligosphaeraceae bacterium]